MYTYVCTYVHVLRAIYASAYMYTCMHAYMHI